MFKNEKYVTIGVNRDIDFLLQIYLWNLIDELGKATPLDYLQVFDLEIVEKDDKQLQKITHVQEIPKYKKEYILDIFNPCDAKIFAIDDESHSTMLLASEY